jgi:hypothetical protein
VRLTHRQLNRTLLDRQHLLRRTTLQPHQVVEHLVGVQAQDPLPPYLGLAARIEGFDPYAVSAALEDRSLVRLLTLRSTIHLLVREDALTLRQWTRPVQERERRVSPNTAPALHLHPADVAAAVSESLAGGPLPMKELGERLAERFPGTPAHALAHLARVDTPLAQLPPRGQWKRSGGVVSQLVDRWLGEPLREPDPAGIVRRYLAAFGPASAADVCTWSGLTGMVKVLTGMDDLVVHSDEAGKKLFDLPEARLAPEDAVAPVRLLGVYDNLWLSHAGRDRVTEPAKRKRWMGPNGGNAGTVFVDGMLEGLWRVQDDRPVVVDLFRRLTRAERTELDEELARTESLLTR